MIYTHAAAAVVALAIGFGAGWRTQGWRMDAAAAEQQAAQAEVQRLRERAADASAARFEQTRAAVQQHQRTVTVEVERVVDRPIYVRECFDDDGLRVLAAAVNGPGAAGQPAPAVPASAASR